MRRLLVILLALFYPFCALSEEPQINVEGEWFLTGFLSNEYSVFTLDELGTLHSSDDENAQTITHDGLYAYKGTVEYQVNRVDLSDDAFLYYRKTDQTYNVLLLMKDDGFYRGYSEEIRSRYLHWNGKAVGRDKAGDYDYIISKDKMYIMQDDSYRCGTITAFENKAFIVTFDTDPLIYQIDEDTTYDAGVPCYLYISTSVME